MSCLKRTYLALGVQLRREIYMYTIYLLCPIFLTDHSRFEHSRNEKCKLEVWSLSLLTSSLAFTPSFICLRPIRSSFRSLNRNSWQFAQFQLSKLSKNRLINSPFTSSCLYAMHLSTSRMNKANKIVEQESTFLDCSVAIVDWKLWFKMIDPLIIRLQRVWWDDCIDKEAFDLSECTSAV